ncbi:MAG: rRNA ((967)-C(5))-methyltransferase RsmB [Pseudomonadota bacterium]|jgi:16S rRNA (cytosine967-C5)-methyltransferase
MSSSVSPPTGPALHQLLTGCAEAVAAVRDGRSLTDALARVAPDRRAGVQALAFTVLRRWGAARAVRSRMAPKPPAPPVDALLCCALALLWPPEDGKRAPYPDHTLVDQAVQAVRRQHAAAGGFVNAVLRRFIRERAHWVEQARATPEGAWNHPVWWIDQLRRDWPQDWQALLQAADRHPPMTLRVNTRRVSLADYRQHLAAAGLAHAPLPEGDQGLALERPCPVQQLPGWDAGWVSVQDRSAQRAAALLIDAEGQLPPLPPGARVLDACSAPGGKTAHLLERADLEVLALDADAQRLQRVGQTLERLGLQAGLQATDAARTDAWWDGRPFDAILLDAPCSASGIVRRHPDVRWLRRASDIPALARLQAGLLDALWPLLKPGGRLLYATCSLFRDEGAHQIDAFLQRQTAIPPLLHAASPGHLLPLPDNAGQTVATGDGFYYALLVRR